MSGQKKLKSESIEEATLQICMITADELLRCLNKAKLKESAGLVALAFAMSEAIKRVEHDVLGRDCLANSVANMVIDMSLQDFGVASMAVVI